MAGSIYVRMHAFDSARGCFSALETNTIGRKSAFSSSSVYYYIYDALALRSKPTQKATLYSTAYMPLLSLSVDFDVETRVHEDDTTYK